MCAIHLVACSAQLHVQDHGGGFHSLVTVRAVAQRVAEQIQGLPAAVEVVKRCNPVCCGHGHMGAEFERQPNALWGDCLKAGRKVLAH